MYFWAGSVARFGIQALTLPHLIKREVQNDRPARRAAICQNQYVNTLTRVFLQNDVSRLQTRRSMWATLRPWYESQISEWETSIYGFSEFPLDLANLQVAYRNRDEATVQKIVQKRVSIYEPVLPLHPLKWYSSAVYFLFFAALPVRQQEIKINQRAFGPTAWQPSQAFWSAPQDDRAPLTEIFPFQNRYTSQNGLRVKGDKSTLCPRHCTHTRKDWLARLGQNYNARLQSYGAPFALDAEFSTQWRLLSEQAMRMSGPHFDNDWLPGLNFNLPIWSSGAMRQIVRPVPGPMFGPGDFGVFKGGGAMGGGPGFGGGPNFPGGPVNNFQGPQMMPPAFIPVPQAGPPGFASGPQPGPLGFPPGLQSGPSLGGQWPANSGGRGSGRGGGRWSGRGGGRWSSRGGGRGSRRRGYRAARATLTDPGTSVQMIRPRKVPFLTIAEVGDHRNEDDFWVLGGDGAFGYDVFDATG